MRYNVYSIGPGIHGHSHHSYDGAEMSYLFVKEQGDQSFALVLVLKIAACPYNCTIFQLSKDSKDYKASSNYNGYERLYFSRVSKISSNCSRRLNELQNNKY